jgi:hypothetical protein
MDYALARNAVVTVEDPEPDYIDGDRAAGITGSFPPAKFFNQLQREVLNVIEGAELVPSNANLSQLYEAILALIAEHSGGGGGGGGPYVPTTRALTAGTGLSGGGTLAADRTFNLDLSDLTAITELQAADMFGVYDNSAAGTRKISWETLLGLIADALDGDGGGCRPSARSAPTRRFRWGFPAARWRTGRSSPAAFSARAPGACTATGSVPPTRPPSRSTG